MNKKSLVLKKISYLLLSVLILLITFSIIINLWITNSTQKFIYSDLEKVPESYVAIVLGAKVYYDGSLSAMLADRVKTGIDLYQAGKVKKILFSGDHGQKSYDEVNAMRKFALEQNVPEQDIFMDHAGFDTYDSMYRARDVFLIKNAIVVTQAYHLDRALFIARSLKINAYGITADRQAYAYQNYADFREYFANLKAFADCYLLKSKPRYLGNIIPITEDGRKTLDS